MQPSSPLKTWYQDHAKAIAGIDEAGRGPLAGPVVAGAVILDPNEPILGLADSKKLTPKKRDLLFDEICARSLGFAVAEVDSSRIDAINILQATKEAMANAFLKLSRFSKLTLKGALIDGNQRIKLDAQYEQHTVVQGDNIFEAIMAASILAKVHRDREMLKAAELFPVYGFEKHKGYGTKAHLEALQTHGPCPIHRQSFSPVRECATRLLNQTRLI